MNDNLIPFNERTESEVREIATRGGKASGEARRLKKSMKLALKELLEEEVKDKHGNSTGKTYQELVNIGLLKGAMKGNANNYKVIAEMLGELDNNNDNELNKVNELLEKIEKGANNG